MARKQRADTPSTPDTDDVASPHQRLSLLAEHLDVSKQSVETGRVRVGKEVESRPVQMDVPLQRETVDIQRIALHQPVDAPLPVRQEGDVLIIPVHEQVMVTQWILREEVHVRLQRDHILAPIDATLLRERIAIERTQQPPARD
jgi:uncharacterized protein (TIGR02271 family)